MSDGLQGVHELDAGGGRSLCRDVGLVLRPMGARVGKPQILHTSVGQGVVVYPLRYSRIADIAFTGYRGLAANELKQCFGVHGIYLKQT